MLNNFDPNICIFCNLPTEDTDGYKVCYRNLPKGKREVYGQYGHFAASIQSNYRWEEISIEGYVINFYPSDIRIFDSSRDKVIIIMEKFPLKFENLDTPDKIEAVIQNYNLMM